MREKISALTHQYVRGEIERTKVIEEASKCYKLNTHHKEGIIFNLFGHLFEDPEDNELSVTRRAIIRILTKYIKRVITLEDAELWFWDVLHLTIDGNAQEEELISYLLSYYDNLDINGITGKETEKVLEILKNVSDSDKAQHEIEKLFERKKGMRHSGK